MHDPEHAGRSRELRDRFLEQLNGTATLPQGKYDIGRLAPLGAIVSVPARNLPAAA